MRGIFLPDATEDFSPLGQLIGLAVAFASLDVVDLLLVDPDWGRVGKALLIFLLLWVPCMQVTWPTRAVSGRQGPIVAALLVAAAACVTATGEVGTAFDDGGLLFALAVTVIHVVALWLNVPGVGATGYRRDATGVILVVLSVTALIIGGVFDGSVRIVLWIVALLLATTGARACSTVRRASRDRTIRSAELIERTGLVIVFVLFGLIWAVGGDVVEALADSSAVDVRAVVSLAICAIAAACLLQSYGRVARAAGWRTDELDHVGSSRLASSIGLAAHAPIVVGALLIAAGLEQASLHPAEPVDLGFRAMLAGGLAGFIVGLVALSAIVRRSEPVVLSTR